MKKRYKLILIAFILLCTSSNIYAEGFVRQNNFLNEKNRLEKTAQIKKFQAINNLNADGIMGELTKNVLYNPKYQVIDLVSNPPTEENWIVVNTDKKILTLYQGKTAVKKYAVAVGTASTPTPNVKGKIQMKAVNPAWGGMYGKYEPKTADDPTNPLGERWLGLNLGGEWRGYGIHGTIYPAQIGKSVSNGCVRMFNYDIETELFPIVKVGTPVWLGDEKTLSDWGIVQDIKIVEEESIFDNENASKNIEDIEVVPFKYLAY